MTARRADGSPQREQGGACNTSLPNPTTPETTVYSDPLAYFLTWTTYGTWLPGDERGWYSSPGQWSSPDNLRKLWSQIRMTEDAIVLNHEQRQEVESTIRRHCEIRG